MNHTLGPYFTVYTLAMERQHLTQPNTVLPAHSPKDGVKIKGNPALRHQSGYSAEVVEANLIHTSFCLGGKPATCWPT